MSRDLVPIHMRDPFLKDPFFSSTWEEFDKMRQDMMAKSKDFWQNVDQDMVKFESNVRRQHEEMDRQMQHFRPQLPKWAIPDGAKDMWAPMIANESDQVIKVNESPDKFEVTLDVSHYKPEELKVSTVNNTLSVEGKHEEAAKSGSDSCMSASSSMMQFSRKWTLPANCDPNEVVSNLSSDGVLMITAPKKALQHQAPKAIK